MTPNTQISIHTVQIRKILATKMISKTLKTRKYYFNNHKKSWIISSMDTSNTWSPVSTLLIRCLKEVIIIILRSSKDCRILTLRGMALNKSQVSLILMLNISKKKKMLGANIA